MMPAFSLSFFLLLLWSCKPSPGEQEQVLHSDHTVFAVNKLAPRARFLAYETEELAAQNKPDLRWMRASGRSDRSMEHRS
jgi:hypothetical protein